MERGELAGWLRLALTPARAQDYMEAEVAKWRPIVAATGAKLE